MEAYVNVVGDVELDRFWILFAYFCGKISCCLPFPSNINAFSFSLFGKFILFNQCSKNCSKYVQSKFLQFPRKLSNLWLFVTGTKMFLSNV